MHRNVIIGVLVSLTFGSVATPTMAQDIQLAVSGPRFIDATARARGDAARLVDAGKVIVLRRRVTLDLAGVTIDSALKAIRAQADLELAYTESVLPDDRRVSLHVQGITVAAALTEILLDAGVDVAVTRAGQLAVVRRTIAINQRVSLAGAIAGRITDKATGAPLGGATIVVAGTAHRTVSTSDGRYRLADVPSGTRTVRAQYIGYAPIAMSVTIDDNTTATLDFALGRSPQKLDEMVTVTPGGMQTQVKALPTPVTVITAEDIEQQHPATLGNVFRQAVPSGVSVNFPNSPVTVRFSARGASSLSGLGVMKVFIDGVETSSPDIAAIDPGSVERIEVIRGPQASTLYGADAAGGVVQITTKRGNGALTRPVVEVQALGGAAQTPYTGARSAFRQQYTASVRGGGPDVSYNVGAGYTRLSDWLPDGEISRQSNPSLYGRLQYSAGIITADIHARYSRSDVPFVRNPDALRVGLVSFSRPQFTPQTFTNETYGARIAAAPNSWWRSQLTVGADRNLQEERQAQRRLTTAGDTLLRLSDTEGRKVSLFLNSAVNGHLGRDVIATLTGGVDYYRTDVMASSTGSALSTSGTIETDPPGAFTESRAVITNTGYFAQTEINVDEAFFLTAGLRADDNSTFGADLRTPVSPRVGLSVVRQIGSATLKLRGAYGRAIRAPSPGQAFGIAGPNFIQLANPLLRPERQRGWDGGIDLVFGGRGSISLTGFTQIADDLITSLQVPSTPIATFQFQNIGRLSNKGIEVEAALFVGPVRLNGQYGYVRSRVEELGPNVALGADVQVGDRPLGVPTHTAGASLTTTPWEGTALTAGVTYVGANRQTDLFALLQCFGGTGPCQPTPRGYVREFPGFAKVNLTITQRVAREVDAIVTMDNATNNFANEAGGLNPVMGRVTMVGVRARL